jgi:hypothetical protein
LLNRHEYLTASPAKERDPRTKEDGPRTDEQHDHARARSFTADL